MERLTQEMPGQVMLVAWLHSGIVCIWPLGCNEPCCKPRLVQLVATLLGAMAVLGENVGAVTASRASKLSWCQLCVCQLLCQAVAQVPLWVPVVCKITRCCFWNPVMANTHKHIERESRERGRESAQAINTLQQQCLFFFVFVFVGGAVVHFMEPLAKQWLVRSQTMKKNQRNHLL